LVIFDGGRYVFNGILRNVISLERGGKVLIDKETAIQMIKYSKGKIFGVTFVKRTTGDIRNMSARLGVSKSVTGEGLRYDPESKQLMTVYDMHKKQYRMLNTETLYKLNMKGHEYSIAQVV